MNGTIVLAGSIAQRTGKGGSAWVRLQYLLGFKRLGWEVVFVDRLEPEMCVDERGDRCHLERSVNLAYLRRTMEAFGLAESWCLLYDGGRQTVGLTRAQVLERAQASALLINIMGFLTDPEILAAVPRRVFLDLDPGFGQMWRELKLADIFQGHDAFVTIGENIGQPGCTIPTCGLSWVTTPQPIVLDHWRSEPPVLRGAFTSVASWRGAYGPVEYGGTRYGLRVHEFRKFIELPRRALYQFELALDIHPVEARDIALFASAGWFIVSPRHVASDPASYQRYVQQSLAEFGVAKNMYVQSNSGWVSDRTLCYLATGRPAVVQDTGFRGRYPTGAGLLAFATLEEAADGVEAVVRDYPRHSQAAREIAEAHFDSDKVLPRLLTRLGVN